MFHLLLLNFVQPIAVFSSLHPNPSPTDQTEAFSDHESPPPNSHEPTDTDRPATPPTASPTQNPPTSPTPNPTAPATAIALNPPSPSPTHPASSAVSSLAHPSANTPPTQPTPHFPHHNLRSSPSNTDRPTPLSHPSDNPRMSGYLVPATARPQSVIRLDALHSKAPPNRPRPNPIELAPT